MNKGLKQVSETYRSGCQRFKKLDQSQKSQRTVNNSLPFINSSSSDKVNEVRQQINTTKNEIALLKARINSLKEEKAKNDKKKQKIGKRVEFIQTARQRFHKKRNEKKKFEEQRKKELKELKDQTAQFRIQLIKDKQTSKSLVKERKSEMAMLERKRRQEDEEYIQSIKNLSIQENQLKAKVIKQEQLSAEEKMKEFNESRIIFAKENHKKKIQTNVKEQKRVERMLQKLREQSSEVVQEWKKSEAEVMKSYIQLQDLNPEKRHKTPKSSRASYMYY